MGTTTTTNETTETTYLTPIKNHLNSGEMPLVNDDWDIVTQTWGEQINLNRDYVRGDQRLELTQKVADLMHINKQQAERFNVNYCKLVVKKMTNRLTVTKIKGSTDEATEWADDVMRFVRFDALQKDLHKATVGDGDSFLMVDGSTLETEKHAGMIKESAYNGYVGVIPVYDETKRKLIVAIKIWESPQYPSSLRVNFYYEDRIEKFVMSDGNLESLDTVEWVDPMNKEGLGVPFFQFKNDSEEGTENGQSRVKSIISLSDALNSDTLDVVAGAGLTALPPIVTTGMEEIEGDLAIGAMYQANTEGIDKDKHPPTIDRFPAGDLSPLIDAANFFIDQISVTTETPLPSKAGNSNISGEALKQLEVGLVADAQETQIKFGNVYEDVFAYANKIERILGQGEAPPESDSWHIVWKSPEVRDDNQIITNIVKVAQFLDHQTILEEIAQTDTFKHWDKKRIEQIMKRKAAEINQVANPPFPTGPATPPNSGNPFAALERQLAGVNG